MAVLARSFNVPVYGVAESYKFVRYFPLNAQDLPSSLSGALMLMPVEDHHHRRYSLSSITEEGEEDGEGENGGKTHCPHRNHHHHPMHTSDKPRRVDATEGMSKAEAALVMLNHATVDYTPPTYITLLFTDIGLLTPSSVSDELIKLYF